MSLNSVISKLDVVGHHLDVDTEGFCVREGEGDESSLDRVIERLNCMDLNFEGADETKVEWLAGKVQNRRPECRKGELEMRRFLFKLGKEWGHAEIASLVDAGVTTQVVQRLIDVVSSKGLIAILNSEAGKNRIVQIHALIERLCASAGYSIIHYSLSTPESPFHYEDIEKILTLAAPFVEKFPDSAYHIISLFNEYRDLEMGKAIEIAAPFLEGLDFNSCFGILLKICRMGDDKKTCEALSKMQSVATNKRVFFCALLELPKEEWNETIPSLIVAINDFPELFKILCNQDFKPLSLNRVLQLAPVVAAHMKKVSEVKEQLSVFRLVQYLPNEISKIVRFVKDFRVWNIEKIETMLEEDPAKRSYPKDRGFLGRFVIRSNSLKRLLDLSEICPYKIRNDDNHLETLDVMFKNSDIEKCKRAVQLFDKTTTIEDRALPFIASLLVLPDQKWDSYLPSILKTILMYLPNYTKYLIDEGLLNERTLKEAIAMHMVIATFCTEHKIEWSISYKFRRHLYHFAQFVPEGDREKVFPRLIDIFNIISKNHPNCEPEPVDDYASLQEWLENPVVSF